MGDAFEAGIQIFFVLDRFGEGYRRVLEGFRWSVGRFWEGLGLGPLACEIYYFDYSSPPL